MSTGAAKLSVATPVVTTLPEISADWQNGASIEDLALQRYLENLQALAELHPPDGGPT
jgi:hypothetical protein